MTIKHKNPTNASRQQAAHATLAHYVAAKGNMDTNFESDLEGYITDLLTDLRHLCGSRGIDFDARVESSAMHYAEEMDN